MIYLCIRFSEAGEGEQPNSLRKPLFETRGPAQEGNKL